MAKPAAGGASSAAQPSAAAPERVWTVDEHVEDILSSLRPLEPLPMRILDALGCVLAEDVAVVAPLPPFDNSSMDGYAVRVVDVADASERYPAALNVVGEVPAGRADLPQLGPGEALRIMTGAPIPPGAEAVVPNEWTDGGTDSRPDGTPVATLPPYRDAPSRPGPSGAGEVRVYRPAEPGAFIRRRGSDLPVGRLALAEGTVLGPAQIGLLAAIGRDEVTVRPRPRVVVLSTGSELVPPGQATGPGRIPDSNGFMLAAAVRTAGADAFRVGPIPDEAAKVREVVEDQLVRADLLVTSGGASVGGYDVVREVLEELGAVRFRRLAMQPGKPQGFGRIGPDRTPFLAFPGNPVSAYVSFELFGWPAIRTLMGVQPARRSVVRARCTQAVGSSPLGKRQYLRGRYDPVSGEVTPVGGPASHLLGALALADALIVVPENTTSLEAGAEVNVIPLD